MPRHYEPEEVSVIGDFVVVRETDQAWLLYFEEANEEVFIPKSQIMAGDPEIDSEIEIPLWLAEKKGLVDG